MSSGSSAKATLAKKLMQKSEIIKKDIKVLAKPQIPDIEDLKFNSTKGKSPYFSPLQTRQQRKKNNLQQTESESVPLKKELQVPAKKVKKSEKESTVPSDVFDATNLQWKPKNWQKIVENIRLMRSSSVAPVDSMGCHKCSDDTADEKSQRYQKLIALMLSSQTKDETTYEAMKRLKTHGLIPATIVSMETSQLEELLRPVSFYKNKAKYIQQTSHILIDKYKSDIPNNVKELVALPGVGPKMAHICMATAWNEVTGIGVDVHVHRISNRLHWVPKETKEPEQTRVALEAWLPRDLWREVNHLLVGFGQTICTPLRPNCGGCLNRDICPSADKNVKKVKISS